MEIEEYPLLGNQDDADKVASEKLNGRRIRLVALFSSVIGTLLGISAFVQRPQTFIAHDNGDESYPAALTEAQRFVTLVKNTEFAPGLIVTNKYIVSDGPENRPSAYPWLHEGQYAGAVILEPFHEATFTAIDAYSNGASFLWSVMRPPSGQTKLEIDLKAKRRSVLQMKGMSQKEIDKREPLYEDGIVKTFSATSIATPLVHTFNELGYHLISLKVTSSDSAVTEATAKVVIKYVRREIRNLDDEDRVNFFAAWETLIDVGDEDGVNEYGLDFMSYKRLSSEHNNFAGDRDCDHMHDGMGFVPGHISVGRLFEASLQSVDASIAIPYWEYTIEVEKVISDYGGDFRRWRDQIVFTDKWFGKSRLDTGHIESGLFQKIELSANNFSTVTNSYGLIRSTWNNLKEPKLARFIGSGSALGEAPLIFVDSNQMSTCETLYLTLNEVHSLAEWNGAMSTKSHQPIHMFTGGQHTTQSGTPNLVQELIDMHFKEISLGSIYADFYASGVTFFFSNIKSLWRYGLYNCPESCSSDTPQTEVVQYKSTLNFFYKYILEIAIVLSKRFQTSNNIFLLSSKCACQCDAEEIMASSYINDTYFGKLSVSKFGIPRTRRLFELLCSYQRSGEGIYQGDSGSSGAASDPTFWVIHGTVERYLQLSRLQGRILSESWEDAVFDSNTHPKTESCRGHHKMDSLIFGKVDGMDFLNGEYYDYLSPTKSDLPYVYDNFEFKHCEELGYDITARTTWNDTVSRL